MLADNGRNFLGAKFLLLKTHQEFMKSVDTFFIEKYDRHDFIWTFLKPYALHTEDHCQDPAIKR